ncbi:Aspartate/methionine/tyrosine aminotransferase [Streptomyces zhaozhouensis]|uniref:Aspartate/methionine/tyrosine aminotransferase n=1 Tax=Streptomyces zhaozhouensis TaxID=1300267 RepID=A0A286DY36_9ACTN|nr:pyridoxal phosphate-dependent aminotransferase [Streptomyces zhaozhouensis]SOD63579.1 Aspartate/methionine/tyrosine aminotransferase [Streptomyces zhaozhouensis]
MPVSRLRDIPGIGVDALGDRADALADPELLRLENLDTDLRPPHAALVATHQAIDLDSANSYLPFQGSGELRRAAAAHVGRIAGRSYDPETECVSVAGGLNGVLNALLATVEPGDEVVLTDPVYAGLVNRVRLAGGVPRFVPSRPTPEGWRVEPEELAAAVGPRTAAVLLMSPAMPGGELLGAGHWAALAEPCRRHGAWLIYDAAMERIRFDGLPPQHPAGEPGLAERTITVGSASKELRMIGWRVGWVVGPAQIVADIRLVGLTNVVCQVGLGQRAVAEALAAPDADADVAAATDEWRQRAETVVAELAGYPLVRPGGGWSLLVDAGQLGFTASEFSERLLARGKVVATPMDGWGPSGGRYVRLVYSNEPVHRLTGLAERVRAALL